MPLSPALRQKRSLTDDTTQDYDKEPSEKLRRPSKFHGSNVKSHEITTSSTALQAPVENKEQEAAKAEAAICNPCKCAEQRGKCPLRKWCVVVAIIGMVSYTISIVTTAVILSSWDTTEAVFNASVNTWEQVNIRNTKSLNRSLEIWLGVSVVMFGGHCCLAFSACMKMMWWTLVHPVFFALCFVGQYVAQIIFQLVPGVKGICPFWIYSLQVFPEFYFIACSIALFRQMRAVKAVMDGKPKSNDNTVYPEKETHTKETIVVKEPDAPPPPPPPPPPPAPAPAPAPVVVVQPSEQKEKKDDETNIQVHVNLADDKQQKSRTSRRTHVSRQSRRSHGKKGKKRRN